MSAFSNVSAYIAEQGGDAGVYNVPSVDFSNLSEEKQLVWIKFYFTFNYITYIMGQSRSLGDLSPILIDNLHIYYYL